jgi:hypothetical protein
VLHFYIRNIVAAKMCNVNPVIVLRYFLYPDIRKENLSGNLKESHFAMTAVSFPCRVPPRTTASLCSDHCFRCCHLLHIDRDNSGCPKVTQKFASERFTEHAKVNLKI